ncbi:MAG: hypothetical protein ACYC8T_13450 [Myxococcaceae bacterium]
MPSPISLKFSTGSQVAKKDAVLEQASKRAGHKVADMGEAAKILESSFVADAGAAVKDGKITAAEQGQLGTDAFFAAGAQALAKGGSQVSFETLVSVTADSKGQWWATFNGSANAAQPTVSSLLAQAAAQHPNDRGASVAAQQAKGAELDGYRKLALGNPFYVLKNGDNLTKVARDLVTQAYLQKAASSNTPPPWLADGAKMPNGRLVNVAEEKAFVKQYLHGSFQEYAASDRFKLRAAEFYGPQIEASVGSALSAILAKNDIADPNYVQMDAVLGIPNLDELKAAGVVLE